MRNIVLFFTFHFSFFIGFSQTTSPMLTLNTSMHTASINRISTDASGRLILTCSNDKTAKLWNSETGILMKTFRIPIDFGNKGTLYAGAISPDGKMVAIGGVTGFNSKSKNSIYIFNVSDNTLMYRIVSLPEIVHDIEFSPNGNFMVATFGNEGMRIFNTSTGSLKKSFTDYGADSYNATFDNSGRLATVCFDGKIRLYSKNFELIKELETTSGKRPISLAFSPDGALLAVGYDDSYVIQVYDSKTLKLLYEPSIIDANTLSEKLNKVSFSADGTYLMAGGSFSKYVKGSYWCQIRVWSDKGKGAYSDYSAGRNAITDIKPLPDNSFVFCSANPDLGRMKIYGAKLFYNPAEINAYNASDASHLIIDSTGFIIGVTPNDKPPITFRVKDRLLNVTNNNAGTSYSDSKLGVIVSDWFHSQSPVINSSPTSFLASNEISYSVDISNDARKIVFGTFWNIYCIDALGAKIWETPVESSVWSVNISDNSKVVVAALGDGTIRWYCMDNGTQLFTLFLHPDNQKWVLWSPKGFFDCSKGADGLIGWHVNQGLDKEAFYYPVSQFFEKFYVANLGAKILAGEEIIGSGVSIRSLKLPPSVKIISPNSTVRGFKLVNNILQSEQQTIEVTVLVTDQGGAIDEILLYLNGKLVETTNRGFKPVEQKNTITSKTYTITLSKGENIIKTTAFNSQRTEAIADEIAIYLGK